jgi:hypothetical protein
MVFLKFFKEFITNKLNAAKEKNILRDRSLKMFDKLEIAKIWLSEHQIKYDAVTLVGTITAFDFNEKRLLEFQNDILSDSLKVPVKDEELSFDFPHIHCFALETDQNRMFVICVAYSFEPTFLPEILWGCEIEDAEKIKRSIIV